ncbi:MAG: hypothetical protein GX025_06695, partial [Clostridiales bacterium]|nr:hypothetical protein [Clostridiales bacterium]
MPKTRIKISVLMIITAVLSFLSACAAAAINQKASASPPPFPLYTEGELSAAP